jgi:predicted DsbA family dithiol-disulfide isomerase
MPALPALVGDGVQVEIWSDVVCPWCYIGKRRFERALAAFPHRDEVEVVWRSFELDPQAPEFVPGTPPVETVQRLAEKYGVGREGALEMTRHVTSVAAGEGLTFDLEHAVSGNTRTAHRLLHAARHEGGATLQGAVKERLLRGYFSERVDVGDPDALARLAAEAGMDEAQARRVAHDDAYAAEVDADIAQAQAYGANGVPFFVVDGRYGISGAQPVELFGQALARAWAERTSLTLVPPAADGADHACGPDGCAV